MTSSSGGLSGLRGRGEDGSEVAAASTAVATSANGTGDAAVALEAAVSKEASIDPEPAAAPAREAPSRPTTPPPTRATTTSEVDVDAAAAATAESQPLPLQPQTPQPTSRDTQAGTLPATPPPPPPPPAPTDDDETMRDAPSHTHVSQNQAFTTPVAQKTPPNASIPVDEPMLDAPQQGTSGSASQTAVQQTAATLQHQQNQQSHRDAHPTTMAPENYQPSTPFTPASMSNLDQHAYMMMALASMSGAQSAMSPPPTVTPSQVTLPTLADDGFNGRLPSSTLLQAAADKGLESFARIEFADSVFQMTTYAVIVGRDQRALEQARRDEKHSDEHKRRVEENASKGLPPPSPIRHDRSKFSKSYVSEEGGMLGPESDSEENGRPAKRRRTSTAGSSQNDNEEAQDVISNRQYVSHTPGAAAVDLTSLRPSPLHVPFIAIHSPGPNIASKTKAISREHLKISYNQGEGVFEAIPLHKNGFFCEDVHYKSDKVVLKCGDRLQIKDIDFRFIINGVERGCTGAEEVLDEIAPPRKRHTQGGKEMSFDFEQSHGNGEIQDTSDELSDIDMSPPELSDLGDDDDGDEEGEEPEEGDEDDSELKNEPEPEPELSMPQIPKKRGPGRPPKNGFMSKREQRLLKKQQQEMAKKTVPQAPPAEPPIKRKVGRPRKHPLPEEGGDRPEKRKYKPRKPKNEEGGEGSDAERRAKEKKEKKTRPKSPALELKIEEYTEEQLQKPNKNYGVLIDETLTAAGPDGLTLKQIYKRICQRYPWFFFHTETKGWESSVRHNLIGNEAFKKDETTNLWSRVPGVELDAGKKRKASSPDRGLAAQGYGPYSYPYNAQQHMAPGAPGFPPNQAPPGYHVPGYNGQPGQPGQPQPVQPGQPQVPPGQPVQPHPGQPGQPGQPVRPVQQYGNSSSPPVGAPPHQPVAAQPPAPTQLPGYGPPPAPARPQLGVPQPGAYSSPYASRPPPPANPPVKTEDGSVPQGPAPMAHPPLPAAAAAAVAAPTVAGSAPVPQQFPAPNGPSATPPANVQMRPVIEPRLLSAVVGLKNGLVENLKKARSPRAEAIVMSALNRCVGLKKDATENDKMEAICIKGIRQVIDGFTNTKSPTPGPGGAGTPQQAEAPSLVFDEKVLISLNGFKEVSIRALKARLGEVKAEAVTLSAIDRVVGLADASIVPPDPEPAQGQAQAQNNAGGAADGSAAAAGPPVNIEGLEQRLIRTIRQLLNGMNQSLATPALASPAVEGRAQRT